MLTVLVALAAGYALGSIPFGLVLTRLAGTEDIRSIGSGNIGATNVLRTGRKGLAAGTLLLDALKGTFAVWLASRYGSNWVMLAAGAGAFLGHVFPIWLNFKGGKGAATYLGVLLGYWWPAFLLFAITWLATAFITRYSSASSLAASALSPFAAAWVGGFPAFLVFAGLTTVLWWKHAQNIERLRAGTESKIGQK